MYQKKKSLEERQIEMQKRNKSDSIPEVPLVPLPLEYDGMDEWELQEMSNFEIDF